MKINYGAKKYDVVLLGCVLFLVVFGLVMVYSASSYVSEVNYGNKYYFLTKQIVGVLLGSIVLVVLSFINVEKLKKFKWLFMGLSIVLLVLVFVPGLGKTTLGASRWINIGPVSIQPSEIAKFGFVFFAASMMSSMKRNPRTFKAMLPVLASGGLVCLLVILEPNMSITMCVGLAMLVMLFVGGFSIKNFLLVLLPIVLMVPLLIVIEPYRLQRLSAFLDPWSSPLEEGFQLIQSYYALGSGGLFGLGYGNSRQKNLFLPFAESDFIFAIIGEELGFIVTALIICVYVFIIIRGYKIAISADSRFKCYLATGITSVIAIQTILNLCVCMGLIPPTGLPLPFISAGSTSIISFMAAVGMLISCGRKQTDKWFYKLKN